MYAADYRHSFRRRGGDKIGRGKADSGRAGGKRIAWPRIGSAREISKIRREADDAPSCAKFRTDGVRAETCNPAIQQRRDNPELSRSRRGSVWRIFNSARAMTGLNFYGFSAARRATDKADRCHPTCCRKCRRYRTIRNSHVAVVSSHFVWTHRAVASTARVLTSLFCSLKLLRASTSFKQRVRDRNNMRDSAWSRWKIKKNYDSRNFPDWYPIKIENWMQ